ncbi:MAG: carbonic anhydrase family protein [Burkholderiaceae bacterium]|nr:carbonic anhydrase family protein [Burkholderiaceae bacterium]
MQVFRLLQIFLAALAVTAGSQAGTVFARDVSAAAAPVLLAQAIPTPSGERPQHIPLAPIKLAVPPPRPKPVVPKIIEEVEPEFAPIEEDVCAEAPDAADGKLGAARRAAKKANCPPKPEEKPLAPKRVHWAYEGEGEPANWGNLRSAYRACAAGPNQSPIDIRNGIKLSLDPIEFAYLPSQVRIVDSGYTAEFKVAKGLGISVMGKRYELTEFHFHRPAETQIEGKSSDMELQLLHQSEDGQMAIIAVMIEKGREHPLIQTLLNNLPLEWGMEVAPTDPIDPMQLLPETLGYWTYMGSLTTPPCTEDVVWLVMKQPLQISSEQFDVFKRFYRKNARPLQPLNGRLIKESH